MAHIPAPSRLRAAAGGVPPGYALSASAASRSGSGSGAGAGAGAGREPNHLLQETRGSTTAAVWLPSFGLVFRCLVIVRLVAARFAVIADCDETYNYWEALHLLVFPPPPPSQHAAAAAAKLLPFQTWEYAPQFAIRSYAYLLPYLGFAKIAGQVVALNKLDTFYIIRNMLAVVSSLVEAKFCMSVADNVHPSIAKYTFVFLIASAGMSSAATALLPSTFTMYTSTLALAYAFYPTRLSSPNAAGAPSNLTLPQTPYLRTLIATSVFALGAILGWPFAIVLALPFVAEELFLPSGNQVPASLVRYLTLVGARFGRFLRSALLAGLVIGGLTTVIDTLAYGRFTVVSLGIVIYNVLSAKRGAGPELYGTEPASYYFANLGLAFNLVLPLALLSIPLLLLITAVDPSRIGPPSRTFPLTKSAAGQDKKHALLSSSRLTLLLYRLAPFYLWLGLLTLQAHKEERFMFPAYPLLCFNAAVSVYALRTLVEKAVGVVYPANKSPRSKPSRIPTLFTTSILVLTSLLSVLRTVHLQSSFYAPTAVLEHFGGRELPQLIGRAFPQSLRGHKQKARLLSGQDAFASDEEERRGQLQAGSTGGWAARVRATNEPVPLPALTSLVNMSLLQTEFGGASKGQPEPLRLCYGKEWYRFPGHFFVPHGVSVDFVKSEFSGILPKHYAFSSSPEQQAQSLASGPEARFVRKLDRSLGWAWPLKNVTRTIQTGFNDMNREEPDRYVPIDTCDYLVDLDHPHRFASQTDPRRSSIEPRHAIDAEKWTRVHCVPFLDAGAARGGGETLLLHGVLATLDRTLFVPAWVRTASSAVLAQLGLGGWEGAKQYGDFCLLRTTRRESWANRRGSFGLDAE